MVRSWVDRRRWGRAGRIILAGLTGLVLGLWPGLVPTAQATPSLPARDLALRDQAAAWLGQRLADGGGLAQTDQGDDYVTTVLAILGLSAAGVGGDQIRASATALAQASQRFIGSADQVGVKTTSIAWLILALGAAGLDPTELVTSAGSRNLPADLAGVVRPDGQIGDYASVAGQAVAVMALSQTPAGVPASALDWLEAQPCADPQAAGVGGFGVTGAGACVGVDADTTALVVRALAMAGATDRPVFAAAVKYLVAAQDPFGGWAGAWTGVNTNSTGLVLWALRSVGAAPGLPDLTLALANGQQYIESVSFDCATAGTADAASLGAIAYDSAVRHAPVGTPAPGSVGLVQSTARGLLAYAQAAPGLPAAVSPGLPAGFDCPAGDQPSAAAPGAPSPPPSGPADLGGAGAAPWLWSGGALVVLVGLFLLWRRVERASSAGARRPKAGVAPPDATGEPSQRVSL